MSSMCMSLVWMLELQPAVLIGSLDQSVYMSSLLHSPKRAAGVMLSLVASRSEHQAAAAAAAAAAKTLYTH